MNEVTRLQSFVKERFPKASLTIDAPKTTSGSWWLDISLNSYALTVEWRPQQGFGVSTVADVVFGEGPDEVYQDVDSAFQRIKDLMLSQIRTQPPEEVCLSRLRKLRSLSQVELARCLGMNQSSLSKIEHRTDIMIGTLRHVIKAMGGSLELRAVFPDEVIRLRLEEETKDVLE
jgi:DNA-binding transcriptional regulator YiaG